MQIHDKNAISHWKNCKYRPLLKKIWITISLTLTSSELLNPALKEVWIRSHRLWTLPPSYRTKRKDNLLRLKQKAKKRFPVVFLQEMQRLDEILSHTSVSTGNRFFSEQGIFTDTSSHASLNLLGYGKGNSVTLMRSVCKREAEKKERFYWWLLHTWFNLATRGN